MILFYSNILTINVTNHLRYFSKKDKIIVRDIKTRMD